MREVRIVLIILEIRFENTEIIKRVCWGIVEFEKMKAFIRWRNFRN